VEGVREAIETAGCRLVFLPGYWPDLNPIASFRSKVKGYLRKLGARTRETLETAIGQALALVTPSDLRGWFAHAGYRSKSPRKRQSDLVEVYRRASWRRARCGP
jgi:transposase